MGGEGILTFGPGENKKIFSVPTYTDATLTNTTKTFKVKFTDELLPEGVGSNLRWTWKLKMELPK